VRNTSDPPSLSPTVTGGDRDREEKGEEEGHGEVKEGMRDTEWDREREEGHKEVKEEE
jgi:hypothetical protein